MSNYCTKSINNKLLFFVNGKRVSLKYYSSHYGVNEKECLTKEQRKNKLKEAISNYDKLNREHSNLLSICQQKLETCQKRLTEVENSVIESGSLISDICEKDKKKLQNTIDSLRNGEEEHLKAKEELRDYISSTNKSFDDAKKKLLSDIESLHKERNTLSTSISDLTKHKLDYEKKYEEVLSEKNVIGEERDSLKSSIVSLKQTLSKLRQEHDECMSNNSTIKDEIQSSIKKVEEQRDLAIKQLESIGGENKRLSELETKNQEVLSEKNTISTERDSYLKKIQEQDEKINNLVSEISNLRDIMSSDEEVSNNTISSYSLKNSKLEYEVKKLMESIQRVQQTNSELGIESDKLKHMLQQERASCNISIRMLEAHVKKLARELDEEERESNILEEKLEEEKEKSIRLAKELEKQKLKYDQDMYDLHELVKKSFAEDVLRRNTKFTETKVALENQLSYLNQKFNDVQNELDKERSSKKIVDQTNYELDERIKEIEIQLNDAYQKNIEITNLLNSEQLNKEELVKKFNEITSSPEYKTIQSEKEKIKKSQQFSQSFVKSEEERTERKERKSKEKQKRDYERNLEGLRNLNEYREKKRSENLQRYQYKKENERLEKEALLKTEQILLDREEAKMNQLFAEVNKLKRSLDDFYFNNRVVPTLQELMVLYPDDNTFIEKLRKNK